MLKKLFEALREGYGVTRREFTDHFNSSVNYLRARYGDDFISPTGDRVFFVESENSPCPVCEEYLDGIGDNIVFLKTGNEARKVDFIAKSEYAYRSLWRSKVKNAKVRGDVW